MIRVRHAHAAAVLALSAALAVPAAAAAPEPAPAATGGTPAPEPGAQVLTVRAAALLGRTARFRGSVGAANAGRAVRVERLDDKAGWLPVAAATVEADGSFLARWRTDHIGRFTVRAVLQRDGVAGAQTAAEPPLATLTVYRPALATWYGPGFYGRRTACGQRMSRRLLGVAHPALPCGTQVDLYYEGRSITVAVVDRGPFAYGAKWDLTAATARALGFTVTDRIGAVALRGASAQRR